MRTLNNKYLLVGLITCTALLFFSCKEEIIGNDEYAVNPVTSLPPNAGKNKAKTDQQYVAILHANLMQKALSANEIFEISQCIASIGDKSPSYSAIPTGFV